MTKRCSRYREHGEFHLTFRASAFFTFLWLLMTGLCQRCDTLIASRRERGETLSSLQLLLWNNRDSANGPAKLTEDVSLVTGATGVEPVTT